MFMASVGEPEEIPFFYNFICHKCKEESNVLKNCSGCHLVSYCSAEHQKTDWRKHKDLCRCIQQLLKKWNVSSIFGVESKTVDEWRHVRLSLIYCVQEHLSRPLAIDEKQMFYYAKVCRVCFSMKESANYKCHHCHTVYCSEEHRDKHIKKHLSECAELRNCYIIDKLCFDLNKQPKKMESYIQISLLNNTFPDDMMTFINNFCQFDNINSLLFSESLSGILSLVFSIFSCARLPLTSKESLEIHIIGASIYEHSFIENIEVLFHCISAVKEVAIFLIGPDYICSTIDTEVDICDICRKKKLSIKGSNLLYHKFALSEDFKKPDIIVAFNCGYNEFNKTNKDTWKASLSHVLELKDILFVFTSYTKNESIEDYRIVKELAHDNQDVYFNKTCYENPYRSHRPHRDWEVNDNKIFYLNNYISIVEING